MNDTQERAGALPASALIVASDGDKRRQLVELFAGYGVRVREAESAPTALEAIGTGPFDVVVPVDDVLHGPGRRLIADVTGFDQATAVVAVVDSTEGGRRALSAGAYDIFLFPLDGERFSVVLGHIGETIQLRVRSTVLDHMMNGGAHLGALLTRDPHMIAVLDAVRRLARYRSPVLVFGERGTELEEVARALHDLGRPDGPFVACAATPLSVAELRAHQTAAVGGTLFLDDVTALAADVSAALMAALESASVGTNGRGVRVVAGCPSAEPPSAEPGDPRSELYRHLSHVTLRLSPLRQRKGDAVLIARELAAGIGRDRGRDLSIARGVEDVLLAYAWPGNVDELKAVVVTAATAANGPAIELHDLPTPLADQVGISGQPVSTRRLRDLEVQHLRQVIEETRGNKSRAARILGLSRWALQRKLSKHGITLENSPPHESA